jgi:hypothetical protein
MSFATQGSFPASIVPAQVQTALNSNYLNFADGTSDWAQQYLPELYEAEVERYGNRTLGGFLRMVGAEMPMTSDQVLWSEQNRLHVAYKTALYGSTTTLQIDLTNTGTGTPPGASANCAIKVNNTILFTDSATGLTVQKALVTTVSAPTAANIVTLTILPYDANTINAAFAGLTTAGDINVFVYGSEFEKGSTDTVMSSIQPEFTEFANSPIIIRDKFQVSGSDAAQIGWVEVATEDGTSGYLWYLKAESETRLRFEDYMEMAMVEGELKAQAGQVPGGTAAWSADLKGTQGLFAAIEARGNVYQGFAGAAAPGSGAMGDFDEILKNLDKQGAIEENMLSLSRQTALDFDDMVAAMNGGFPSTAAASYGLFDNQSEMALNFGFSGFRRGSYDFYKTDWKYLNDASTRGLVKSIDGVMVPAGTTTVYDQMLGSNIRRPFLHVRYRASETEDRRYKNWITGSVGGAYTDNLDAMTVHFLTERCLVTQAANNFVLFKAV